MFRSSHVFLLLARLAVLVAIATAWASPSQAEPVLTEFMASNTLTLKDEDGAYSDWIEIYNPDATPLSLAGWFLTDSASAKTKWQFPAVTLPAESYLIVWASNKNRREPNSPLHTNFALSAGGEYLGLIRPDGQTVVSEFAPTYPSQSNDLSYGSTVGSAGTPAAVGYLRRPTPGAANAELMLLETVTFSRDSGPFGQPFTLTLSGAAPGQRIRYLLVPPSATGATAPEPTAESPEYTGPITIDATVIVRAAVFSADDSQRGLPATAHFAKIAPPLATFTSRLPVMVIDNHGLGSLEKDGIDHPSWLYTYSPRGVGAPVFGSTPDLATPITSTVRGSSSADFPKKGYNVKLTDTLGNKRALPVLGSSNPYEKWALVAPWNYDRTYVQNSVAYSLSNRIGRWAPRTQLTEVFFHCAGGDLDLNAYAGIYVLTDRIEVGVGRVALNSLSPTDATAPEITGGYIFKIDLKDEDEFGWITAHGIPANGYSSVVLAYPKADDVTPAQRDYLRDYVQRMENALVADRDRGFASRTYLDYLDRPSWVDHHILNVFASNLDGLERSAYFTKDRGGKIVAGPVWDFDRAFASADPRSQRWDTWINEGGFQLWNTGWWGVLAQDPEFMQDWVDRWQALRQNEFSPSALTGTVDALAASIGNNAAARDAARWPDNLSRFGNGHAGEIDNLKTWLTRRAEWIDTQFVATPPVFNDGSTLTFTPPNGAQLAYTLDGSDPRSLGGAVAPNALLTAAPLTVPVNANIHVRSYDAARRDTFPGTPWSSAVAGGRSSPLTPVAKLINLSSRALIGAEQSALIAGVVVADTDQKSYLVRGIGPTLASFGAANTLPDPVLGVFRDDGVEIYRNNAWQAGLNAAELPALFRSVGAFPLMAGSHDAALIAPLASGAYTMRISSENAQGGLGLAELYTLDTNGRTTNLSTRAMVRQGEGLLIGGFVVQGPAYKRMLVRAVGPTLAEFGVTDALADPVLKIYSGNKVIATVDDWAEPANASVATAASTTVGAFALPVGSKDAALFITLPPGAYTLEVSGKDGSEGVALLEVYDVP